MKLEHHHCRPRPFPAAVPELGWFAEVDEQVRRDALKKRPE
jgi:hypothetical protein